MSHSIMSPNNHIAEENYAYQRRLADSLLEDLGIYEAVQWCQELGWDGVIQILMRRQNATGSDQPDVVTLKR
jgi:hypothetical protein